MIGFAVTSWFLSMWISNVASMTLMLPIVEAILLQMDDDQNPDYSSSEINIPSSDHVVDIDPESDQGVKLLDIKPLSGSESKKQDTNGDLRENDVIEMTGSKTDAQRKRHFDDVAKAMTLSITYAGKCGGMATLTGTPANMIMKSQVDEYALLFPFTFPSKNASWLTAHYFNSADEKSFMYFYFKLMGVERFLGATRHVFDLDGLFLSR